MNLIVDIGNTRTKYAVYDDGDWVVCGMGVPEAYELASAYLHRGQEVNMILSSTGAISEEVREHLKSVSTFFCEMSPEMDLPIRLGYDTPKTLGVDRIAGCVGGVVLFPGKELLIIDSGTAITYDFVSADGEFRGGNISPGLGIRFRALNEFTVSLPLVKCDVNHGYIGKNTHDAILNGVMNGTLFEIRCYIDESYRYNPDAVVIITGGGSEYLKKTLNRSVFFEDKLVNLGLNRVLEYQKRLIGSEKLRIDFRI